METQTDAPTQKNKTIETQTDEQSSQETQTEPHSTHKKRQRSEQPETSNPSKKAFEDFFMDEFLASDDGAECESLPSPSKNIDDEAVREMIRRLRPSPPPEVSTKPADSAKSTGNGKFKTTK